MGFPLRATAKYRYGDGFRAPRVGRPYWYNQIRGVTSGGRLLRGHDGQDLQVAFNSKYLLDVLAIIGSEEVTLGFTGPLNPGLIKPVGNDNYLYIIMPVRVAM